MPILKITIKDELMAGGDQMTGGMDNRGRHLIQMQDGHRLLTNIRLAHQDQLQELTLVSRTLEIQMTKSQIGVQALHDGETGMRIVVGMAQAGTGKLQYMKVFIKRSSDPLITRQQHSFLTSSPPRPL